MPRHSQDLDFDDDSPLDFESIHEAIVATDKRDRRTSRRPSARDLYVQYDTSGVVKESSNEAATGPAGIPVFEPADTAMQAWDTVMMFLLLYTAFLTVYQVAFPDTKMSLSKEMMAIDLFVMAGFFADIAVRFNLAFFSLLDGILVTDRSAITKRYLRGWFWLDLGSTIPWDLMGTASGSSPRLIRLLRLVKLLKLVRASKVATHIMKISHLKMSTWAFFKTLLFVVVIIHWCSCLWMMIGTLDNEDGWTVSYKDSDAMVDSGVNITTAVPPALNHAGAQTSWYFLW